MRLNHLNLRVADPAACQRFYEICFGFRLAFEADGGPFLRNDDGFLLALIPVVDHQPLPDGFHIGFTMSRPEDVVALHDRLREHTRVGSLEDYRPDEDYITFRCWDPDNTEIEVFWDAT